MNNYIVGYLEGIQTQDSDSVLEKLAEEYGVGLKKITKKELFQFSECYLPGNNKNNFIFSMSDLPDCEEADYLIDYLDYAPEMDMKFPSIGKDRLKMLVRILIEMINQTRALKLVISLTDSGYIYSTKLVKLSDLEETLLADFEEEAPPDRLYEIIC